MKRSVTAALLSPFLLVTAHAQRPSADEQKRVIDAAREIAIHYTSHLPDFICTENVARTDMAGTKIVNTDKLTIQLSFSGQKENYKLAAINGIKTTQSFDSLDGLITGGEFGSLMLGVFDPSSGADFQWKEASSIRKHQVAIYTYEIARAKSHYILGHRLKTGGMQQEPAGYHGEIALDSGSSRVFRLTAAADDIPKDSGILQSSVVVDYDFIDVAGRSTLLPSRSEAQLERSLRRISNVVTFTGYKKFEADSKIDFKLP